MAVVWVGGWVGGWLGGACFCALMLAIQISKRGDLRHGD